MHVFLTELNMSQTPRRSTRLVSATGSVAGSVAGSIAASTVTPSRTVARRKGPLPKLKVNQSHAYGASGQFNPAVDLQVPTSGFSQAFDSQRDNAVHRDDISQAGGSRRFASVSSAYGYDEAGPSHYYEPTPIAEEASPVIGERTSVLDVSKSFGTNHEGGMNTSSILNGRISPHTPATHDHAIDSNEIPQPSQVRVAGRFLHRNWSDILKIMIFLSAILSMAYIFIGATTYGHSAPNPSDDMVDIGMIDAIKLRAVHTWYSLKHGLASGAHRKGYEVSDDISERVDNLEGRSTIHDRSIKHIQEYLPEKLAVPINRQSGKPEITDDFWRALLSKMQKEGFGDPSTAKEQDWAAFLKKNEAKVEGMFGNALESRLAKHNILTRDQFMELMDENYTRLSDRIQKKLDASIKEIGNKAVRNQMRIESLAYANLVANSELALKTVNFFSPGLGAKVDPYLTSPTQSKDIPWKSRMYTSMFWIPARRPPVTALERWEEASDCWCAAAAEGGKAQLAVTMAQKIFPTKVTVEHVPKEGTLDPRSAPKWMELWVEIKDVNKRLEVINAWNEVNTEGCSEPRVSTNFVCIGRFRYDIHAANHVQTFNLELDLAESGVAVTKTVVRVTENWGRPWTCMYRIRMHGELVEPVNEMVQ